MHAGVLVCWALFMYGVGKQEKSNTSFVQPLHLERCPSGVNLVKCSASLPCVACGALTSGFHQFGVIMASLLFELALPKCARGCKVSIG